MKQKRPARKLCARGRVRHSARESFRAIASQPERNRLSHRPKIRPLPVAARRGNKGVYPGFCHIPKLAPLFQADRLMAKTGFSGLTRKAVSPGMMEMMDHISMETTSQQAVSHQERILLNGVIDSLISRATEVIGSRQEAMRWLGTPVRGLDFATPISLLATEEGQIRIYDILGQMEHGIW